MSAAPPPGSAAEDSTQTRETLHRISQAIRWSLLGLPPSPGVRPGGLAGVHRANPFTPLDASSYVVGKSSEFLRRASISPPDDVRDRRAAQSALCRACLAARSVVGARPLRPRPPSAR